MHHAHRFLLAMFFIALFENNGRAQPEAEQSQPPTTKNDEPGSATPLDYEAARRHFQSGLTLLDQNKPVEAAKAFEKSLAVRKSLPALYNLGLAYRRSNRFKDALRVFEEFLDEATRTQHVGGTEHAKILATEIRSTLSRVTLHVKGNPEEIRIDGVPVEKKSLFGLLLNPGDHVFEAIRDGQPKKIDASLEPGTQLEITLDTTPEKPKEKLIAPPPPPPPPPEEDSILSSWWFWAGAVVVVAGATVGVVAATQPDDPQPDRGSTGILLKTLRF